MSRQSGLPLLALLGLAPSGAVPAETSAFAILSTALLVTPLNEARIVRGDDGKDHVEYDRQAIQRVSEKVQGSPSAGGKRFVDDGSQAGRARAGCRLGGSK
jgi:hypothetical protein